MKIILSSIFVILLMLSSCNQSTAVSADEAKTIAYESVYESSPVGLENVFMGGKTLSDGSFVISLRDVTSDRCTYIITVQYDGKILNTDNICTQYE